jgi:hypothetical protein
MLAGSHHKRGSRRMKRQERPPAVSVPQRSGLEERGLKETGLTELQMEPKIRLLFADVLGKNLVM